MVWYLKVRYGMVSWSVEWYGFLEYGMLWYLRERMASHDILECGMVCNGILEYGMAWYDFLEYGMVW